MKLFQWVHRKLRQNSIDPFNDFTPGNPRTCLTLQPTLDNQYSQTNPCFSSINQLEFPKSHYQDSQTCYPGLLDNKEEDRSQVETPAIISELFEGFLTIGTLGAETVTDEPPTPTFAIPSENTTMRNAEVTENELKLISYELEKFLEAETEESFYESGRNSYVSTITLSGKQIDGSKTEDYENKAVCPLQGYLLGSSFELLETTQVRKERASLGELFQRTKAATQDCREKGVKGEKQVKQTHKSVMHIITRMLKRVPGSSKSCHTSGNDAKSASANKKLHKVLRMFHRKVYPEDITNAKSFLRSHEGKIKNDPRDCFCEYDDGIGNPVKQGKGRRFHSDTKSRKGSQQSKSDWNPPPQHELICSSSTGNNEHWIKTDADYLVLEL